MCGTVLCAHCDLWGLAREQDGWGGIYKKNLLQRLRVVKRYGTSYEFTIVCMWQCRQGGGKIKQVFHGCKIRIGKGCKWAKRRAFSSVRDRWWLDWWRSIERNYGSTDRRAISVLSKLWALYARVSNIVETMNRHKCLRYRLKLYGYCDPNCSRRSATVFLLDSAVGGDYTVDCHSQFSKAKAM